MIFNRQSEESPQVDVTSPGDKVVFTKSFPINIIRWGIIADVLIDVGTGLTIKMDHRPIAGSDTGRTNGTPSTAVNLVRTTDIAQGKGVYVELTEAFEVDPGEEVVFQVTDAADTAGTGVLFVEYDRLPFQNDSGLAAADNRLSNMTDVT